MSEENQTTTFSQEIIKKSNKTVNVIDDLGRTIVLRKPKFSSYLELLKALGPELSKNQTYVETVGIVSTITSMTLQDGQNMPIFLKSLLDVDHTIKLLEESEDALTKIAIAINENFTDIKTQQEYEAALKK